MSDDDQETIEDETEDAAEDEIVPLKYSITSYGADYPVDGLVKRLDENNILIPHFQRGFVWKWTQASRFVESLLLGLPVPGIFLSKDEDSQKLIVIDGQQRLRTLQFFYSGIFADSGKEFRLRGVQEKYSGATYDSLSEEDKRRLNDSIIHATIIRQDEPSEDDSSVYYIFERLNTGGTLLNAQEIRASIYHGEFNSLLKEMNGQKEWREIIGPPHPRMKDQELILRFLALYYEGSAYRRPMKEFLNLFMHRNRHLQRLPEETLSELFSTTVRTISKYIGREAFKPIRNLNTAFFDAVMIGVCRRMQKGPIEKPGELAVRHKSLISNDSFMSACLKATADNESVNRRLKMAIDAFGDVP
jgi:hypothetical protein